MKPVERDLGLLEDMFRAAQDVQTLMQDQNWLTFSEDWKTRLAVERLLQIIGEAANRISLGARSKLTELPWERLISVRHTFPRVQRRPDDHGLQGHTAHARSGSETAIGHRVTAGPTVTIPIRSHPAAG
jgi:hypothetical protein